MEFFKNANFDFMGHRRVWAVMSTAFVLFGVLAVFVHGKLNVGIDFAGGTQIILRFQELPNPDTLRKQLAEAGIDAAQIQRFGEVSSDEVMIRTPLAKGKEEGDVDEVKAALSKYYNPGQEKSFDLNERGANALSNLLFQADPMELKKADVGGAKIEYGKIADDVMAARKKLGIFSSWTEISNVDKAEGGKLDKEIVDALKKQAFLGKFAVLGQGVVGPAIGKELRMKGVWAVVLSIVAMLAYIWIRFELRFGLGAVIALIHDVLVTLGLFAIFNYEFNLSTVAAFLTLVGYSVNDTVVVFDRVRENMQKNRRKPFFETINESINQTLSRTILTSGTTILAVTSLFLLGGDVLRGFAFVLMVGVVVGTYSSIFVASSFALFWDQHFGEEAAARKRADARSGGGNGKNSSQGKGKGDDKKLAAAGGSRRR